MTDDKKLRDVVPSLAVQHEHDRSAAQHDFDYTIERRDSLNDRIQFGSFTINGASLLALMGVLGGNGEAAQWLGFTPSLALFSAGSFTLGCILAGHAINQQLNQITEEAGDANTRIMTLRRLAAMYDEPYSREVYDKLDQVMKEHHASPLIGFRYSNWAITVRHLSGGCWLAGILAPIIGAISSAIPFSTG